MIQRRSPLAVLLIGRLEGDADLVREALSRVDLAKSFRVAEDAETALILLQGAYMPRVRLVLLNLDSFEDHGRALLSRIKSDPRTGHIPVIGLASRESAQDARTCYDLLVNAVIRKPRSPDEYRAVLEAFIEFWVRVALFPDEGEATKASPRPLGSAADSSCIGAPAEPMPPRVPQRPDSRPLSVLLVEDNPGDVRLVREALALTEDATTLEVAPDAEAALAALRGDGKNGTPQLVILDLNLPSRDGRFLLSAIKNAQEIRHIPVIVWTSSDAPHDVRTCYGLQANAFVKKPGRLDEYLAFVRTCIEFWARTAILPDG